MLQQERRQSTVCRVVLLEHKHNPEKLLLVHGCETLPPVNDDVPDEVEQLHFLIQQLLLLFVVVVVLLCNIIITGLLLLFYVNNPVVQFRQQFLESLAESL